MDELVQLGYVAALENVFFDERIFLDMQIMPSGEARLRGLSLLEKPLSKN